MRFTVCLLPVTLLCASCATATNAPLSGAMLPPTLTLPALDPLPPALELSFTDRMRNFLSGKLPELTKFEPISANVEQPTALPGK